MISHEAGRDMSIANKQLKRLPVCIEESVELTLATYLYTIIACPKKRSDCICEELVFVN